jgi:putative ABC transport system permease protein
MSWFDGLSHRLRTVFNPGAFERELQDEMRFHEELDATQQRDATRARRRFGNRTYYQEETRHMTWLASLDVLRQDLGYAWRSIRRTPGFTLMVVATLALGIGVNAATFSVLDRIYLRPPAGVVNPEGLRRVWTESFRTEGGLPSSHQAMNYPMFRDIARALGDSTRAAVRTRGTYRFGGTRKGPEVEVHYTSANYFDVLGVRPARGRFYTEEEARPHSGARMIVLSDRFWRSQLSADPSIIGRSVLLDTMRHTVIGIAPPAFDGIDLEPTKIWAPIGIVPQPRWLNGKLFESERMYGFHAFVRLDTPEDVSAFERRATPMLRQLNRRQWQNNPDTLMNVQTGSIVEARGPGKPGSELVISSRLTGVAVIVLLIASANVVNLLLARAVRRRREIAVRLALGISRARLMRLLTTETLLLALVAAVAATLVGWWGGNLLRSLLLPEIEWGEAALHWRVVAFTFAVALVAGFVAGIIPAIQFSRPQLTRALKEGARDGMLHRSRLRSGLLVAQAALSVVLLAGAALFVRSLQNVKQMDIGFDVGQTIFAWIAFEPGQSPGEGVVGPVYLDLEQRLSARPGIERVARTGIQPMGGFSFFSFYWGADSSETLTKKFPVMTAVSQSYFATLGLRMLRGRTFDEGVGAANQVVVNDPMARMLWPDRGIDVLGECIRFEKRDAPCHTVVGVVETSRRSTIIEEPAPQYYLALGVPQTKTWGAGGSLIVRASPGANVAAIREVGTALRQAFPAGDPVIQSMSDDLDSQYRPWRLGATLFTGFGLLALLVALIGIYSSVSYAVNQRTHEFGVRIALGARLRDVLNQVVGEGLRVIAVGVVIGVMLALAAGRLVSAMLFGVQPTDPSAMLLASCTLLIVAVLAALVPAARAARVDPVTALRAE